MRKLDEIDPTNVVAAEASSNLEAAGYPELWPFLQWVRREATDVHTTNWEHDIGHRLRTLRVVQAPFPVTVGPLGNRYGRFHLFGSLNNFRRHVLTDEMDLFFFWDSICRIEATELHHTQCFVIGMLAVNIERSLAQFSTNSARRHCWELLLGIVSTLICREQRFRWGFGTTHQYARMIRRLIWEANDFALFFVPTDIRHLLRDQLVEPCLICVAARSAQYIAYLGIVAV